MRLRALLVATAILPQLARAESPSEARLREALRSTTLQLRTAEEERAAGKAREAALEKELEALKAQPKVAPPPKANPREVAELKRRIAELGEAAGKTESELARCRADSRQAGDALEAKESERVREAVEVALLREKLAAVETKNERLYQLGKDLLDWLEHRGVGAKIAAREPFLGLKRVELENTAQDFEDKLLEQKIHAATLDSAAP
jgi:hypothetical protein